MTINIPSQVKLIIDTLLKNGFEAYVVGGCVRDSILFKNPSDWDICTLALPNQIKECFNNYHIIETGIKHGTVTIIIDQKAYEITTYRVDGEYLNNRHPLHVEFVDNLKMDLSRRDFTINAMAYNPNNGLIDYFGGLDDLKNKQIKCVGEPNKRFNEDALRIMRAIRFASVYGFQISKDTDISIHCNKNLLKNISVERINQELCKLLCGIGAEYILENYYDIIAVFIPEILPMVGFLQNNPHHLYDVWKHTIKSISSAPNDIIIRLSMLFHDIGKPLCYTIDDNKIGHFYGHPKCSFDIASEIMKNLKFDNKTISTVKELILYHDAIILPQKKSLIRWLNKIGETRLRQLIQVKKSDTMAKGNLGVATVLMQLNNSETIIDDILNQKQCFCLKDLAVNGVDLIEIGIPKGIQIGIVLSKLMDMVINEQIKNDKNELISAARLL